MRSFVCALLVLAPLVSACGREDVTSSALESVVSRDSSAPGGTAAPATDLSARKRTRKYQLHISVRNVAEARTKLEAALAAAQGFLQTIEMNGAGESSAVTLVARVPDGGLDQLASFVRKLGEIVDESQETKDVTLEFVDTDARLRNLSRTEERLLSLLQQSSGTLTDVLAVERELTRVRGEIEQITSQLRALERDIAMATLTVRLSSDEPDALVGPDDAWRPLRVLKRDAGAVIATSAGALLAAIAFALRSILALLPWTPVLALLWLAFRRYRKSKK